MYCLEKWVVTLLIIVAIVFLFPESGLTQTGESLLQAWEAVQKNDPKTVEFRKEDDGSYFFHTTRFPYQGRLVVLNTSIDDNSNAYDLSEISFMMGVVEVDLPDLPEDFMTKHSHSFSTWQQSNYLYYDEEEGTWITPRQWQTKMMDMQTPLSWWSRIDIFWIVFLILILFFLIVLSRKTSGQMKKAMNAQNIALEQQKKALDDQTRGLEISEQSLELIRETRDILKAIHDHLQHKRVE